MALDHKEQRFTQIVGQLRALIDESIAAEISVNQALSDVALSLMPPEVTEIIIGARQQRQKHLGKNLFGEPAWDILLQLHVAHYRNNAISVTAAVTFGDTAPTTGLRWLKILEREGLIERHDDPMDHRRSFVALTRVGVDTMDQYIAAYSEWLTVRAKLRKL